MNETNLPEKDVLPATPQMTTAVNPTPTVARPTSKGGGHWYDLSGQPCFEVPKKTGKPGEMRKTTLADARKLNLLPSVTTYLRVLDKPALNLWIQEQVALAIITTPRQPGEKDDAFVHRVIHEEEQQDQEAKQARELGGRIHDAIESYFNGAGIPEGLAQYVNGPINAVLEHGDKASSELILVGDDYAGMADLLQDCSDCWYLWDFKSAKNLPDPAKGGAWEEHRLQLAAYAKAFKQRLIRAGRDTKPIICANLYISTTKPGEFVICEHEGWEDAYEFGFRSVVRIWQWLKGYRPVNPNAEAVALEDQSREITLLRANLLELGKVSDERAAELVRLQREIAQAQELLGEYRAGRVPGQVATTLPGERLDSVVAQLEATAASLQVELNKLTRTAAAPAPLARPPQQNPQANLPPAMARPAAQTGGAVPLKKIAPTPTLPSAIGGKRVMWDNGRPSAAPEPPSVPPQQGEQGPSDRGLNQAWETQ